jgi:hypothetical protein
VLCRTLEEGGRQIVTVLMPALAGVTWAHAIGAVIEDAAGQQAFGIGSCCLVIIRLFVELGLDGIEHVPIENGRLFALEGFAFEFDLPDIAAGRWATDTDRGRTRARQVAPDRGISRSPARHAAHLGGMELLATLAENAPTPARRVGPHAFRQR